MLVCDIVVTESHAYDFVIKEFVIKKGVLFVPALDLYIFFVFFKFILNSHNFMP